MEVYLMKDEVKIVPVSKAFSKILEYTGYTDIKDVELDEEEYSSDESGDDANSAASNKVSKSKYEGDITLLTVTKLPVAFKSICSDPDPSGKSGRFAERLERKLKKNQNDKFAKLKVELVMSTDNVENSLGGKFVLSSGSRINVFKRLQNKLDYDVDLEYSLEVSLCHLATVNDPVSPEALVCLKADLNGIWHSLYDDRMRGRFLVRIPPEMKQWWEQGTGFIYSKTSVKVSMGVDSVKWVYGCNRIIRPPKDWTYVEIVCRDGKIEKFCRQILEAESKVFREKFAEMEKRGLPLKMEVGMSREAVDAFLAYVYGGPGGLGEGVEECRMAVELLRIGREFEVLALEQAMDEIFMAKRCTDFGYFSVDGALDLFMYTRDVEESRHLRDKAVRVLHNYSKTASEKLKESKEYQDLLQNQPGIAMELTELYSQLD